MRRALSVGLAWGMLACSGKAATEPAPSRTPKNQASIAPSEPAKTSVKADTPLALRLDVKRTPDGVGLSVLHTGTARVELAADVALERAQGQGWVKVTDRALTLRLSCASQGCVTLVPGGELLAPSFMEQIGGERCQGDGYVQPTKPGSYRLVVRTCSGGSQTHVSFVQP